MKKSTKELLLSLNFKEEELSNLLNTPHIEELIVLISSLYIKDIRDYFYYHNYLIKKDLLDLAKTITNTFNYYKDYDKVKKVLEQTNYNI